MYGPYLMRILVLLHVGLLVYRYVPDRTACLDERWPTGSIITGAQSRDDRTVLDRVAESSLYELVSAMETVVMLCVILWGTIRAAQGVGARSYLPDVGLLLPGLLLVSALSIRARHTGIFGCASGDPECCGNMYCSDTPGNNVPGCGTTHNLDRSDVVTVADWDNRLAYCPVPSWYVPDHCSDSLRGSPDLATCYQYGCSVEHTPIQYFSGRLEFATVVLFGIVAITS